ncbi:MAG: PadR family transcriptional regulator [Anaerolineales bacterium]
MSLRHTLLGFLSYGPMTGYDLKKFMDNSTQHFWHAQLSQIYPTLKRMESDGLVESMVLPQEGKPNKKVYSITVAGRDVLMNWLRSATTELPPAKEPNLLRLFFSGALDDDTLLAQLRQQLALHRAQLQRYEDETAAYIEQQIIETGRERDGMMWELAREFGVGYERHYLAWLERAVEMIARSQDGQKGA